MTSTANLFSAKDPANTIPIPDGVCLLAYRGSIAHNMYVPSTDPNSIDDVDLMGVVLAPEECYLGLQDWGARGTKETKQHQYDCVWYEIRKMVSLLLQGNPNVLSLLWVRSEHVLYANKFGHQLIEHRNLFQGKHAYNTFAGYAHAQLEKMETREPAELREYMAINAEMKRRGIHPNERGKQSLPPEDHPGYITHWSDDKLIQHWRSYHKKGENVGYLGEKRKQLVLKHGYDSKNAAHCVRLLRMCKEFLATGEMQVYRESDAAELLDIKRGKWPLEQVKQLAGDLFTEIRLARDNSPLPPEPDRISVERMLMGMLREHLANPISFPPQTHKPPAAR